MASSSLACCKLLMMIFNVIYVIFGVVMIVVAAMVIEKVNDEYVEILGKAVIIMPAVTLGIGVLVTLAAVFACCGAIRDSKCCFVMSQIILTLLLIASVAVGVVLLVFNGLLTLALDDYATEVKPSIQEFNSSNTHAADIWNTLQQEVDCCGIDGPLDWKGQPYIAKDSVPDSCCKENTLGCGKGALKSDTINDDKYWSLGCTEVIETALNKGAILLACACFIIGGIQIIGILLACCVMKKIDGLTYSV